MAERTLLLPLLTVLLSAALAVLSPSCLSRWQDEPGTEEIARCTGCHGDSRRSGSALERSAPPRDLLGASDPSYPGVGAHLIHLRPTETHAAIACSECHLVPDRTEAPGHADDPRPAEIVFGELASHGQGTPSYDPVARTCESGYCHGGADAVWTEPRGSAEACGSCHGLPPAAPHPQSERCEVCHTDVIDAERRFITPALHVNGRVEVVTSSCSACHGADDDPAPPPDLAGSTDPTSIGVGAHAVHLSGTGLARPLACAECHVVPETAEDPGHADGLPAEIAFSGVAATGDHAPGWERELLRCNDTYCHGPSESSGTALSPSWIEPATLGCSSCHRDPPPAPHPQMEGCALCHAETVGRDDTISDPQRHVDGIVDVDFDEACSSCHGGDNAAPPRDVSGNTTPSAAGVGAHQAHVLGSATSRAVPCVECHLVPDQVLAPGHVDSPLPAELTFSGAALAFGAEPSYTGGACTNTACHGAVFPKGNDSGGLNTTPEWTLVDGSEASCGSCHGLPPPAPHPYYSEDCSGCHENMAADDQSFLRPDLHVDGVVTFTLP